MELVIDDGDLLADAGYITTDREKIANYLNKKLYEDPEFFGDFGPENIDQINLEDGTPVYSRDHGYYQWVKDNAKNSNSSSY
jgi:hypothetical protein